jgi:hypothetical protein
MISHYLYLKDSGAILSVSRGKPIFKESDTVGILRSPIEVSKEKLSSYRVRGGKVQKYTPSDVDRIRARNLASSSRSKRAAATRINKIWSLLDKEDFSPEDGTTILRLMVAQLFPRGLE